MTKVTVLVEEDISKGLKPIEFKRYIDYKGECLLDDYIKKPSYYDEIQVIKRQRRLEYDLFLCFKDGIRSTYLGDFNDGVVE